MLVVAGYAAAMTASWLAVRAYIALTPGVDRVGAGGMTAFGDSMAFLAILAVLSAPVTGLALYYLRPYRRFWQFAAAAALPITATALFALLGSLPAFRASEWAMFSPIRVLLAPMFGLAFVIFAVFCPLRAARRAFIAATAVAGIVFVAVAGMWIASAR